MPLPVRKTKLISLKKSSTGVFLTQHNTTLISKEVPNQRSPKSFHASVSQYQIISSYHFLTAEPFSFG